MASVRPKVSLFLLICLALAGCGQKARGDDCVQKLSEKIQVGTSETVAEQVLDQCGFIHSFDKQTSTIYGLKHQKKSLMTREDWSAQIKLDESRKVTSLKLEKVATGP